MGFNPEKGNANTSGEKAPKKDNTAVIKALGATAIKGSGK
jgi:hypothetical protein